MVGSTALARVAPEDKSVARRPVQARAPAQAKRPTYVVTRHAPATTNHQPASAHPPAARRASLQRDGVALGHCRPCVEPSSWAWTCQHGGQSVQEHRPAPRPTTAPERLRLSPAALLCGVARELAHREHAPGRGVQPHGGGQRRGQAGRGRLGRRKGSAREGRRERGDAIVKLRSQRATQHANGSAGWPATRQGVQETRRSPPPAATHAVRKGDLGHMGAQRQRTTG